LAARFGWELLPTAGIARLTQIPGQMGRWGRWALGWDAGQNTVQASRGGWDISQHGLTWGNGLQVVGSLLGLGGNYTTWRRLPAGGAEARTPPAAAPSTPTTRAAVSTETAAARPPTAAPAVLRGSQQGAARPQGRAQQLFEAQTGHGNTVAVIRGCHKITGEERTFVSMNGNRQTMPSRWTLNEGEQWLPGTSRTAHAEENILNNPALRDWEFIEGGASRNICSMERCGAAVRGAGMELGGPNLYPRGRQGTTQSMFWRR
jgi:hypothetical protein